MTTISDRYERRATDFRKKIDLVPADAWDRPSPCPEWKTIDVVDHIVNTSRHFLGMIDRDFDAPQTSADPMGAFDAATGTVLTLLNDREVAPTPVESSMMGTSTFEDLVDRFLAFDLVVHSWDLARAAGIDDSLNEIDVREVYTQAQAMADTGRAMGAFGPVVDLRDDADEQTRLLATLGRRR